MWKEEKDRDRANRAAQQVRRAATLTAELAAQSESKVFEVCSHPPGLYDEPTSLSLSTSETAANILPVTSKPPQGARGFSHSVGSFRATRQRSTTRRQDTATMLEETLSLFVEATGKNEASMSQQLVNKRPEELRRDREQWKTRVEKKERSTPRRRKRGSSSEGRQASNPRSRRTSRKNSSGK